MDVQTFMPVDPPQKISFSFASHFVDLDFEVGLNTPYAGVIDTGADAAIMIEIWRDFLELAPATGR